MTSNNDHLEVVKYLYKHKADSDIHISIKKDWTPLNATLKNGHLEVVKYLYNHGADSDIHITTKSDWTPLNAISKNGHLEVVKYLYEHGANTDIDIVTKDSHGDPYVDLLLNNFFDLSCNPNRLFTLGDVTGECPISLRCLRVLV